MTATETTYARFEAIEERLAHCYFLLHERFMTDPQLAAFWVEAAMDELQHSSLLRFCRERSIMSVSEIDPEVSERVAQLVEHVASIVRSPDVSIKEAFYASLLIESSEIEDIFDKLTDSLRKDHFLLYQAIQTSLRLHHRKFAEAAGKFLDDPAYVEAFNNLGARHL
ncbi:MAG: hypothetical protein HY646_15060 [Acidobacteria bacterium]|nr:hypothetical protein [Acidobacteriota bacterium]